MSRPVVLNSKGSTPNLDTGVSGLNIALYLPLGSGALWSLWGQGWWGGQEQRGQLLISGLLEHHPGRSLSVLVRFLSVLFVHLFFWQCSSTKTRCASPALRATSRIPSLPQKSANPGPSKWQWGSRESLLILNHSTSHCLVWVENRPVHFGEASSGSRVQSGRSLSIHCGWNEPGQPILLPEVCYFLDSVWPNLWLILAGFFFFLFLTLSSWKWLMMFMIIHHSQLANTIGLFVQRFVHMRVVYVHK